MSETNGSRKRKLWTAAEKMRIVLAGLQADTKVAELCAGKGSRRISITSGVTVYWAQPERSSIGSRAASALRRSEQSRSFAG